MRRQLNALKREQYPWMFDVTKCDVQEAIIDLGGAFRSFFEKRGKYPRFKTKGVYDSFCAANETGTLRTNGKRIKLPVIGWVRMREVVRFDGTLKRATISSEADRWFVSLTIEALDVAVPLPLDEVVGVDLGVRTLANPSRGEVVTGPKAHTALLKRLRRTSRRLSDKQRGSKNRAKAKNRLARLHGRIVNIRKDATHKATTKLATTFRRIGIEDLNVRGMVRNRHLARSVLTAAFLNFGDNCNTRLSVPARLSLSQTGGLLQARDALAAVRSRPNWICHNGASVALHAVLRRIVIGTPLKTLKIWPQVLRCQPVERNALARFVRAA